MPREHIELPHDHTLHLRPNGLRVPEAQLVAIRVIDGEWNGQYSRKKMANEVQAKSIAVSHNLALISHQHAQIHCILQGQAHVVEAAHFVWDERKLNRPHDRRFRCITSQGLDVDVTP